MERNIFKKSTRTTIPRSVQGAIFHTKESIEERKEKGRKKKQILKAEKQTRGSSLPSLLPGSFLCRYRKEQNDCGVQSGGDEGD